MIPYWLLFLFASGAVLGAHGGRQGRWWVWWTFGAVLLLVVGLRDHVGCDWLAYEFYLERAARSDFSELWALSDPGYQLTNWISAQLGWGVYGNNVLCALIFTIGLFVFSRQQPLPWLAVAVAVPYLVIVVSMGYTRQAVALGFVFWALTALESRNLRRYLLLVALATLFHKTAVLMIPLGLFLFGRGWAARAFAVVSVGLGLWAAFLADYQDTLWENYVQAAMISQGATIRVMMNVVPALVLLVFWNRWKAAFPQSRIWFWMALAAIACVPLLTQASTATDRIALYLTPLQVVVFSRLPVLATASATRNVLVAAIILGYGLVLFVWLNFARHAYCWIPYQNHLFG